MDKQLITLINKLQDVFATVGVSSDSINLPQITVGASSQSRAGSLQVGKTAKSWISRSRIAILWKVECELLLLVSLGLVNS